MKTKLLVVSCLLGSTFFMSGQTTLNIKVNAALDDHEERTSGTVTQSGTLGDMYPGSTGLELGSFNATSDPILVGLRFTNVAIPKFATITNAYIQFTVKGTSKNTDPCNLTVYAENDANPLTFSDNAFSLSTRSLSPGSITWNTSVASNWSTVGAAGTDQRTPNLKTLVQPLVFKTNWVSGNAMAFFIKGNGTREVEAYEGDPTKAAELVVTYSVAGTGTATAIGELTGNSSVNVYPNPFKNSFSVNVNVVNTSDISISVFDLTGKLVEDKKIEQAAAGTFHYASVSVLNPGMYFVKVRVNDKEEILKLISE